MPSSFTVKFWDTVGCVGYSDVADVFGVLSTTSVGAEKTPAAYVTIKYTRRHLQPMN